MSASSEPESTPQRQIGELMTELGLITDEQLATVLEVQQQSKRPLGQIIVELGFASGAAVAHALALQSGGALKTEYGFALGAAPDGATTEAEETSTGLPKLRLAPTAVARPVRSDFDPVEEAPAVDSAEPEAVEEDIPTEDLPPVPAQVDETGPASEEESEAGAAAERLDPAAE